jgi:hypothetical protein
VAGALVLVWSILQSPSSTAAIGLLFVPFVALLPGLFGCVVGGAAAFLWRWWGTPERSWSPAVMLAAASLVLLLGGTGIWLAKNLRLWGAVDRVLQMEATELSSYFARGALREDRFVLGAIAQNPAADAALLEAIAHRDDPALHERMGSLFPLLGTNRRGLAVMRLVARHPNVTTAALVHLSQSPDGYVLGEVAGNEKTPVDLLRRLHARGGYLMEWGLARNPRTPPEILHTLASSSNEYTRGSVAHNSATRTEDLEQLVGDPVWHVRRSVAMNPAAPEELLERLAGDGDDRVSRVARHRIGG